MWYADNITAFITDSNIKYTILLQPYTSNYQIYLRALCVLILTLECKHLCLMRKVFGMCFFSEACQGLFYCLCPAAAAPGCDVGCEVISWVYNIPTAKLEVMIHFESHFSAYISGLQKSPYEVQCTKTITKVRHAYQSRIGLKSNSVITS